ncbi:triose-phosphate isomerase [bacterium]|nr:triose-phosphate isomerase [bacterium]
MRKAIVAGNWKMYKTPLEAYEFITQLNASLNNQQLGFDICLFPNYLSIPIAAHECKDTKGVYIGAQNCHSATEGAYTGETSVEMIKAAGASHVLVGHSERREYFNEGSDELLAKMKQVLTAGLTAVYCCGEKLEHRKSEQHFEVVKAQLTEVVYQLPQEQLAQVVVAYEPVWAIGTGETASPEQAQEMHLHIRKTLSEKFGELANNISILYGGSVKPGNARELFSQPDIDGGLVGGASLKADDFIPVINAMIQAQHS